MIGVRYFTGYYQIKSYNYLFSSVWETNVDNVDWHCCEKK